MFRPQEFEHRLQIIDDKHADLQVSLFVKTTRALEEVLAKKTRDIVPSLFEVPLFFTYMLVFYTTLKVKEGWFWGCFCVPYLSMVDFQVQLTNSQPFSGENQGAIHGEADGRSVIQFRLLAGFLSESWHTRWAQKPVVISMAIIPLRGG